MQDPADRVMAQDVVTRYMNFVDRGRWSDLPALFAERVHVDYSGMRPDEPAATWEARELVASWQARHAPVLALQHLLGGMVVDVNGDEARVSGTGFATHLRQAPAGEGRLLWQVGVAYEWQLARIARHWRITAVQATKLWDRTELQSPAL